MGNINNSKLIRIYGVTLPDPKYRVRPHGHGTEKIDDEWFSYVDYYIDDLVGLIKNQELEKRIMSKFNGKEVLQKGR